MENFNYTNELNENDEAVAKANVQFTPATETTPSGFSVNGATAAEKTNLAVHKMEAALTAGKLISVTDKLIERRTTWEEGAFKSSVAELLSLLADCLALRLHLKKFDDARITFNQMYKTSGFEGTKATSATTKVVRFIFGGKAKSREFAYAKALTIALEGGIQPENFAKFVEDHGGLEELRRNGVNAGKKRQEREAKVKNAANILTTTTPIAQQLPVPQNLTLDGETNFVAAILRKEADGTFSLVHVSPNEALIESLLANAAKDVKKTADSEDYLASRITSSNPQNNQ